MVFVVLAVCDLVEGGHDHVDHSQHGRHGDVEVEVTSGGEGYCPAETEEDEEADDEGI